MSNSVYHMFTICTQDSLYITTLRRFSLIISFCGKRGAFWSYPITYMPAFASIHREDSLLNPNLYLNQTSLLQPPPPRLPPCFPWPPPTPSPSTATPWPWTAPPTASPRPPSPGSRTGPPWTPPTSIPGSPGWGGAVSGWRGSMWGILVRTVQYVLQLTGLFALCFCPVRCQTYCTYLISWECNGNFICVLKLSFVV